MSALSKIYPYNEGSVRKNAPEDPGVYRLSYLSNDGERYVFYVGQAKNLEERLLDHLRPSDPNSCIRGFLSGKFECFFRFQVIWTASERDRIETEEIDRYKPRCNSRRN